jgi:A/G-specific adenine glycosylase
MQHSDTDIRKFRQTVRSHYAANQRDLPWRQPEADGNFDPYKILVSELMLQQTQVARVIPKYQQFLNQFPTISVLAAAPLAEVIVAWSGLGYNRRAKFLWQAAQHIVSDYQGRVPHDLTQLIQLPGIGANTAAAIAAYAFNQPVVFIETNIRTVYIHHFFADQSSIADKDIADIVAATLDKARPREWYWALMDYGTHLKATAGNLSRRSRHYTKQSTFAGSRRQVRGRVLRLLAPQPRTLAQLHDAIRDERLEGVLADLSAEGLISQRDILYSLQR